MVRNRNTSTGGPSVPIGGAEVSEVDVRALLDPEVAAVLGALPIDLGAMLGSLTDEGLGAVRELMGAPTDLELSGEVSSADHEVAPGVVVRVHRPDGIDEPRPCVYWMHGGGMVLGTYAGDDLRFDTWCRQFGIVGVSVEYRLAPEHPYPTPLDDCYAGLSWVHRNAAMIGVDANRIGIAGASAGGGLAAGLGLLARDRGELPVAFQLLIYPMIDDRQVTPSSTWNDPIWPPSANTYGWTAYLGAAKGDAELPIYAAPARATDLAGLPPTLIAVGAIDGFSDEDIDFALRLRHAGVPVELHVYPGAPHGFDSLAADTTVARRAVRDIDEWLGAQVS